MSEEATTEKLTLKQKGKNLVKKYWKPVTAGAAITAGAVAAYNALRSEDETTPCQLDELEVDATTTDETPDQS